MVLAEVLNSLSRSEKLQLMEDLWAELRNDDYPSPDWHKELLEERERRIESGETTFRSWEEAKADILRRIS